MKRSAVLLMTVVLGLTTASASAQADYPSRPIELWIGFGPGGPFDILARQTAPFLEKHLGGNVIVINKPGAGGALMQSQLVNAAPDGYTIALVSKIGLVSVLFGGDVDYKVEDFEYSGTMTYEPYLIFVGIDKPYTTVAELAAAAQADPGGVTIGTAGIGTAPYLALKDFERIAGIEFNIIPSIGAAEMQNNVIGGHIDGGVTTMGFAAALHAENQARIVGVMSTQRMDEHPDIATFGEAGFDLDWSALLGFVAPAGTPREIMDKLTEAVRLTHEDPEFLALAAQSNHMLDFRSGDVFRQDVATVFTSLQEIWNTNPWIQN